MVALQQSPYYLQQIMSQSISLSKLHESTQRGALSLILRSFKSTPIVALETELGILPVDIRLQELNR